MIKKGISNLKQWVKTHLKLKSKEVLFHIAGHSVRYQGKFVDKSLDNFHNVAINRITIWRHTDGKMMGYISMQYGGLSFDIQLDEYQVNEFIPAESLSLFLLRKLSWKHDATCYILTNFDYDCVINYRNMSISWTNDLKNTTNIATQTITVRDCLNKLLNFDSVNQRVREIIEICY